MDTIDLDAIIESQPKVRARKIDNDTPTKVRELIRTCMKEAIHQALVLASESAKLEIEYYKSVTMHNRTGIDIKYDDSKHFAEKVFIDKQSILDIEKLIVLFFQK